VDPVQKKIPQLDVVRGLAILLVMFHNTVSAYPELHLQSVFASGWMGVDLFFVVSGFLITGILLDSAGSTAYLKNFYIRRILRIWPLYYSMLALIFVIIPLAAPWTAPAIFSAKSAPHWSYLIFLQNLLVPIPSSATGPLGVTWSLAVEEQFYLIWPWLIRCFPHNQVRHIAIGVICASPVVRFCLALHGLDIYSNPFCRLDGLMAGSLLAFAVRSPHFRPAQLVRFAWISFLISAPLAVTFDGFLPRWFVHSIVVVAATSFVYLTMFCLVPPFQAIFKNRFLTYTGSISYGLYLLHKLPFDVLQHYAWFSGHQVLLASGGFLGSYVLATLSWNLLEKPFLRLKHFFSSHLNSAPDAIASTAIAQPGAVR
jgi:peptidoglycan/LPS O-acetylase OafA/YrhL